MPIIERDPWRLQYFERVECPSDVDIPTEDSDAYRFFPDHRWVHDKLLVAESQGLACAPHGIPVPRFPVFSKPVYNLRGMGAGSRVLHSETEYERSNQPGHFWMELLTGEHVSSDAAVVRGEARWWRHVVGHPLPGGAFDRWDVLAAAKPDVEAYCGAWLAKHLARYTGMVNVETIGARIIELHLRFSDQWPDLYGTGWLEALVGLYARGEWDFADRDRRDASSVVLFGPHGRIWEPPDPAFVREIAARPGISSVQVTFRTDKPPQAHAMPPGGFRLAIVNCRDLEAGLAARRDLADVFERTSRSDPQATPDTVRP